MIKRYDIFWECRCGYECSCGKHEYADGEFVYYDDHEEELKKLMEKMKCCGNCGNATMMPDGNLCSIDVIEPNKYGSNEDTIYHDADFVCEKWKIREK